MRLGSSLRRRRGEDRTPAEGPARRGPGSSRAGVRSRWSEVDPRARRLLAGVAVALGGWLVGYLGATRVLFPAPAPPGVTVQVPDVRGATLEEALERMTEAGLDVSEVEALRHPAIDSGRVVGQAPLPGQLARPGSPARLTFSLGAERRQVPAVTGLRADRAVGMLEAMGLVVQVDSIEAQAPRGRIVAIRPEEGTELSLPGTVRATVSLGPPRVVMPSILGLDENRARDSLSVLGLEVGEVEEVFRFGRDQGRVVSQEPAEGVELARGSVVRLIVGRRGG
jgi:eukaryotic-like serine/threonine-protein kinase